MTTPRQHLIHLATGLAVAVLFQIIAPVLLAQNEPSGVEEVREIPMTAKKYEFSQAKSESTGARPSSW